MKFSGAVPDHCVFPGDQPVLRVIQLRAGRSGGRRCFQADKDSVQGGADFKIPDMVLIPREQIYVPENSGKSVKILILQIGRPRPFQYEHRNRIFFRNEAAP